jgi:uncharacterized protein (TIGR02118 family)
MAKVLVLYNPPADPAAFDKYYFETHMPLARKLPGLRKVTLSREPVLPIMGTAPHLVAELEFDSLEAIQAALRSPEGQATAADVGNYASGGATILMFETTQA